MSPSQGSSSDVQIPTVDGVANAYFSHPTQVAPAVLVFSDAFGLRPELERLADRLVANGYAVLIPNVFYRNGTDPIGELPNPIDLSARPDLRERVRPLMQSLDTEATMRDAKSYLDFLAASADTTDGPIATSGYCMGARLALRTAETFPDRVAAVAGFHGGGLATDEPDSVHLGVGSLQAEVYLAHADHDPGMPPEQINRLNAALDAAGVRYRAEVYPDAPHGFAMADTTAYRKDAAERHFAELVGLLNRTFRPS